MSNNDGNNPEDMAVEQAFEGAALNLNELRREDGIINTKAMQAQLGVLQRSMTANIDEDYRQELKTGNFGSKNEIRKIVKAFNWCRRYGVPFTMLVDLVIAQSAGLNNERLDKVLETISHTTFTMNSSNSGKKRWWSGSNDRAKSPLSQ